MRKKETKRCTLWAVVALCLLLQTGLLPAFAAERGALPGEVGAVSDGMTPDGGIADEEITDNENADGETADGETADGEVSDGETSDGEVSDGETSDSESPDGETADSETTSGESADVTDGSSVQPPRPTPLPTKRINQLYPVTYGSMSLLIVLPVGADVNEIPQGIKPESLPLYVPCRYEGAGVFDTYNCPVVWDLSSVDSSRPGLQKLRGVLTPGEGAAFAEGFSDEVWHFVFFSGPLEEPVAFQKASCYVWTAPVIPLGGDLSGVVEEDVVIELLLLDWDELADGRTYGSEYRAPIASVDLSTVDVNVCGYQQIACQPLLPEGLALPVGQESAPYPVVVVEEDIVDLHAPYLARDGRAIEAYWLYSPSGPVQPQYRVGADGPWIDDVCVESDYASTWVNTHYNNNSMSILVERLELFQDYYYRVQYEGTVSDELHVSITERNILVDWQAGGGDNDGGDRGEEDFPDLEQPVPDGDGSTDGSDSTDGNEPSDGSDSTGGNEPSNGSNSTGGNDASNPGGSAENDAHTLPTPLPLQEKQPEPSIFPDFTLELPQEAIPLASDPGPSERSAKDHSVPTVAKVPLIQEAPAPEPFLESVTDDATILSGLRVNRLLEINPDGILFEKHGVALELSAQMLHNLALVDDSRLEVQITQPARDEVELVVLVDGVTLAELPDSRLRLPCTDETITRLTSLENDASYAAKWQDGLLTATIDQGGRYRMEADDLAAPQTLAEQSVSPDERSFPVWLLVSGLLAGVAAGGVWLVRRRGGGTV